MPTSVKLDVVIRQEGRCKACGERLGQLADTQFDHTPALQLRAWDTDEKNTVPAANDATAIEAKHKDCHLQKTTGRKGDSRLGDNRNGDVPSIARVKRLTRKEQAFRDRMLSKASGDAGEELTKKKHRWPSRPFPKRKKDEAKSSRS